MDKPNNHSLCLAIGDSGQKRLKSRLIRDKLVVYRSDHMIDPRLQG